MCYKKKGHPKKVFQQYKDTMPKSRYSFTPKYTDKILVELYNDFIIYEVVPYYTNNMKLFQYIFDSIKQDIIENIDRVIYFIYMNEGKPFNCNQLYQVMVLIKTLAKNKLYFDNMWLS